MTNPLYKLLEHPQFTEGVHWERQRRKAKDTIFSEGDGGSEVYLILKGTVRLVGNVNLDDDRRIQSGFSDLNQGEVFGELALFDGQPRSATTVAVTDCELAVIDRNVLKKFLDDNPEIGYTIFKDLILLLVRRLRATDNKLFSIFAWGLKTHGIDEHL